VRGEKAMADRAQVSRLTRGVKAWNKWRQSNSDVTPNLRRAILRQSVLRGADFSRSDLRGAELAGADLRGADLTGADLRGANLPRADLRWANLHGADLRNVDLFFATISDADLSAANLGNSIMGWTLLGAIDLSAVEGLESVRHMAPSSIGIETFYLSKGKIPDAFMRGAGVPHKFVIYMRSLVVNPIEYYSCFISYSSKDEDFAKRLHADLQSEHVRCWFAPEDLKIGDKLRPEIDEAIHLSEKLLLVLSRNSVRSPWVETEVEIGFERERQQKRLVLFPIRLDDAVMQASEAWAADIRRTRHIGDFRQWKNHDTYRASFLRLLRDLNAEDKGESTARIGRRRQKKS
jgi:uncharacterized protein YjbI with pentapeptide repeats